MTTVGQWVAWLCIRWHRTRPLENMVGDFDEDIGDDQVRSRHKTTNRCICVPRDGGACKGGLSRCSRRAYAHGASLPKWSDLLSCAWLRGWAVLAVSPPWATHGRPFHRRRSATLAKTLRKSARSPAGPTLLTVDPKARPPDASTLLPPTPVRSVHHSAYWFTRRVSTQEVLAVGWTVWSVGTLVGRYGTVTSLHIPKKDEAGAGKIFVEYLQMDQAECTTALRTRYR